MVQIAEKVVVLTRVEIEGLLQFNRCRQQILYVLPLSATAFSILIN